METDESHGRNKKIVIELETKYRVIADGNDWAAPVMNLKSGAVGNQVPRYSGWKLPPLRRCGDDFAGCWKPSTAL